MNRIRWLLASLTLLAVQTPLSAQFIGPRPGLHIEFGKVKKNGYFTLSYHRGLGFGGFNPYCHPSPGGYSFTQLYLHAPPPPPIVYQPQPLLFQPPPVLPELVLPPFPERRAEPREEEPERPLPGRDVGGFRPLDQDNRDRARRPVLPMPEPPRPPDKPDREEPMPNLPMPPLPEANPRRESARQVELGKEAFGRREYGLAAERFQRAVAVTPDEAVPHFLLAQAHQALGNYRRAYDAVQMGLRLQPDWPMEAYRPIELYRDNVADYATHLETLEAALADHPDDGVLLFLSAHALWFDGRRDEARELFRRAAPALPDPGVVDRFLQALPGVDL